jgi:hypothetical protein
MSAFICNNYHISILALFADHARCGRYNSASSAEDIGAILQAENVKSVNYRYNEKHEPAFTIDGRAFMKSGLPAMQIIKAAKCLAYQSCEHPGWEQSEAKEILDRIISVAVGRLPGYEEAHWELPQPNTPPVQVMRIA